MSFGHFYCLLLFLLYFQLYPSLVFDFFSNLQLCDRIYTGEESIMLAIIVFCVGNGGSQPGLSGCNLPGFSQLTPH